jgi:hypothetical protein
MNEWEVRPEDLGNNPREFTPEEIDDIKQWERAIMLAEKGR